MLSVLAATAVLDSAMRSATQGLRTSTCHTDTVTLDWSARRPATTAQDVQSVAALVSLKLSTCSASDDVIGLTWLDLSLTK